MLEDIKKLTKTAGRELITAALTVYFCMTDPDTPASVKKRCLTALAYFISPIDVVPDFIPFAGFSDDLGVLTVLIVAIATHIKPEHKERARQKVSELLDATPA